jgi:hypothetical protein
MRGQKMFLFECSQAMPTLASSSGTSERGQSARENFKIGRANERSGAAVLHRNDRNFNINTERANFFLFYNWEGYM